MAALTGALIVAAAPPVAAGPQPPAGTAFSLAGEDEGHTVTLVTGDRVRLTGAGAISDLVVVPGPGREDIGHRRYRQDGDVYVVPHDAAPLIAAGTLDERLFNVSRLIEAGYHDGARADVPVMVSYADGRRPARSRTLADGAATSVRPLAVVNGEAVRAAKDKATRYWKSVASMLRPGHEIEHLWLDAPVTATSDGTMPQIGAPDAWEGGRTGEGVRVAMLDTGVDAEHPDLDDAVVEARDFTGEGTTDDSNGHGTHVAGIIAGDGTASEGRYRGVAPDADLVVGRVLNSGGQGQESWILAGMEWAAQRAPVVNMSLGSSWPDDGTAPLSLAVDRLTEETGTLFVVSSSNFGPQESSVTSPGSADAALTVGAVDDGDELGDFSGRGPRLGDYAVKPEITAPGVDVVAARAGGSELGVPVDEHYMSLSGTSMAAPHVTGSAALVAQARPEWKADRLKAALVGSAAPHSERTVFEQGAGRVDVARAVEQSVVAEPAVLSLGIQGWPRADGEPVTRTVTYTNSGSAPVTLTLDASLQGPDGKDVGGALTVSPAQVTVPAGGQAQATMTLDLASGVDGLHSGTVVATGDDGSVVRTPVGVHRQGESYGVDITVLGHDGNPVDDAEISLVSHTERRTYYPRPASGAYHVTAEKGEYHLEILYLRQDEHGEWKLDFFVEPRFVVDSAEEIGFDVRDAYNPRVELADRPDAQVGEMSILSRTDLEWGSYELYLNSTDPGNVRLAGSRTTHDGYSLSVETAHARPDGNGRFVGSPYLYRLRYPYTGGLPDEINHRVADDDLARVRTSYLEGGPAPWGMRSIVAGQLPLELDEYYTPGGPWSRLLLLTTEHEDGMPIGIMGEQLAPVEVFERGERTQRWNTAVHGPAFPYVPGNPSSWAYRAEPGVGFVLPLHSDDSARAGTSSMDYDKSSLELYRNGELVGSDDGNGGFFAVPGEPASYRLAVHADRGSLTPLSRVIDAEWTFRDDVGAGAELTALPLLGVHFDADFGMENAPRVGEKVRLPLAVQRNGSPEEPRLDSLRVEVSFDGGESWRSVPYRWEHGERVIAVRAPEGVKDVSLRVEAEDVDGNGLKQTIVGAYPVR
ncbi:subtilisin-like serine protease [Saccharomonospora cyanea NA-134]|uniref:Subtilisin-like serine protease n=1 Tax=Saccharomonospora cyanea NA-134 TaxID=882082 RepID=H5XHX2_9PSEU|nr:subtilisin-like serine protease [Saccharomonospora cyanea NA-134]